MNCNLILISTVRYDLQLRCPLRPDLLFIVWTFLRGCQLPYCSLYEQGYTSLGNRLNTVRNSRLAIKVEGSDELRYLPAYMLEEDDSHLERTNRTRNRCNTDEAVKPSACNAEPMLPERIVDNSAQPCVVGEMKAGSDANVARAIVICSTMPGACRVLTALSTVAYLASSDSQWLMF